MLAVSRLNKQGQDGESVVKNDLQDGDTSALVKSLLAVTMVVLVLYTYWLVWGSQRLAPLMFKHRL